MHVRPYSTYVSLNIILVSLNVRNDLAARGNNVLFARASTSSADVNTATQLIRLLGGDAATFAAESAIVATWNGVESYLVSGANRFQLIVAYTDLRTYAIFDYREALSQGTSLWLAWCSENESAALFLIQILLVMHATFCPPRARNNYWLQRTTGTARGFDHHSIVG